MFRHQGKSRKLSHNQKIASLLSFVAGVVNVVGFIAIQILITKNKCSSYLKKYKN